MAEGTDTSSYPKFAQAPSVLSQAQGWAGLANAQQALATSQQALAANMHDRLTNELAAAASDPNITPDQIVQRGQRLVKEGVISPNIYSQMLTTLPTPQQIQADPLALKKVLDAHLQRQQDSHTNFNTRYGVPQTQSYGAGLVSGNVDQRGGGFNPQTITPQQVAPGVTSVPRPEIGPDGKPTDRQQPVFLPNQTIQDIASGAASITPNNVVTQNRLAPPVVQGVQGGMPTGLPPGAVPPRLGTPQPQQRPPMPNRLGVSPRPAMPAQAAPGPTGAAPQAPVQAPQPAPQAGPYGALQGGTRVGLPAGVPQGSEAFQGAQAGQQANAINEMQRAAAGTPQAKALLDQLNSDLERVTTGPFAGMLAKLGAGGNQISTILANKSIPGMAEPVAAAEAFKKNSELLRAQQSKALGSTVEALQSAGKSVPSLDFSKQGNREIIANLKGAQDLVATKNAEYQKWREAGGNPQDFSTKFEKPFNESVEPRAFMLPYLDEAGQRRILSEIPAQRKEEFKKRLQEAKDKGWIK